MRQIIILIAVLTSVPFVMRQPLVGLMIYLGINIFRPEMLFWGGIDANYVYKIYYVLLLVLLPVKGYLRRVKDAVNIDMAMMVLLLVGIYLSIAFSSHSDVGLNLYFAFEILKAFLLCAAIFLTVNEARDVYRIEYFQVWVLLLLGVWGILQYAAGNYRLEGLGGAAWGDSNNVAAVNVLFLPVALFKVLYSRNRKELISGLIISSVVVSVIIFTLSRAGFTGVIAALSAMIAFRVLSKKQIAIMALLSVLVLPLVTEEYIERITTMKSSETLDYSAKSRIILWELGLKVFYENPLFGSGFMTYPEAKMKFEDEYQDLDAGLHHLVFRKESKRVAHNTYIQMASECGLFGVVPLLFLICLPLYRSMKCRRFTDNRDVIFLAAINSGIFGYYVCLITMDAIAIIIPYFQITISSILYRKIVKPDLEPVR